MEVFVMGKFDDEDDVYCTNCEKKILQDKAIYVGGKPYCKTCSRDAEDATTLMRMRITMKMMMKMMMTMMMTKMTLIKHFYINL